MAKIEKGRKKNGFGHGVIRKSGGSDGILSHGNHETKRKEDSRKQSWVKKGDTGPTSATRGPMDRRDLPFFCPVSISAPGVGENR